MKPGIAIVSGAIANKYRNGGEAWIRMSWALGLQRLGFDVCFLEEISRESCTDAFGRETSFEASVNLAWFRALMDQFGLSGSAALIYEKGEQIWGLQYQELLRRAKAAGLLVNISGHLTLEPLKHLPRCKVYIDEDPGYTQIWHSEGLTGARLVGHDFFFTLGGNIGSLGCSIPIGDIAWRPIRSPLLLEEWPICQSMKFDRFTTVASWRGSYGPVQYEGKTYGVKAHEFRKFIGLPRKSGHAFQIALRIDAGDRKDLETLQTQGWQIVDPKQVAGSPNDFREYVQHSAAEFSVAQGVYVDLDSGWFSDRTVRYLASGKPALIQDTGFSRSLPVGEGLFAFRTLEEAVDGAQRIIGDYERHCRAARRLAEEFFDSDRIIRDLISQTGIGLASKPKPFN